MSERQFKLRALLLRGLLASAATATLTLAAAPASAQALDERIWLELSGYMPNVDTVFSISRTGQPGTSVSAEDDLGLEDRDTLPAFYAGWRLGERQRWVLTGEYYALNREGSSTLNREIIVDGITYPVGVTTASEFTSDVWRATVGYSFIRNERSELGVAVGIHATDFAIEVTGQGSIGGGPVSTQTHKDDYLAPLPTIGFYGTYEATPKWILNSRLDFMALEVDEYGGGITNFQASAAYRFTPMFSAGVSYRYVAYDLDVTKPNYTADVEYEFSGPSFFLRMGFR